MPFQHSQTLGWLIVLGAILASCGEEKSEEERVVEVTANYQDALLDADGERACDLLTGRAKRDLAAEFVLLTEGQPDCERAVEAIHEQWGEDELRQAERARDELGLEDVEVEGSDATVTFPSGRQLKLTRADGEWLVADSEVKRP